MTKFTLKNKIISGLLSALMTLSLFVAIPVNSTAATAEEHTVNSSEISNDYLKIISNGSSYYSLYTTGGNPNSATDNDKRLLYAGTSETFININGNVTAFSINESKATATGDSLYSCAIISNVKVERFMSFVYNTSTGRYDTVEYKYVLTNQSQTTQSVGTRIMFDTMLGDNDHAPFRVNGETFSTGREYSGAAVPQTWNVFDNLNNPTVVASGTFYNDPADKPDKVQFLNWGIANDRVWDCNYNSTIGDSAVNVYFNPIDLAPGQSRTVKTYYGLSQFVPNIEPVEGDLAASTITSTQLVTAADGLSYLGNPFSFSSWVTNPGGTTVNNVVATLTLPEGLTAANTTVNLGNVAPGQEAALYWDITAANQYADTTLNYTLTLTGDGIDPVVYNYSIFIPALTRSNLQVTSGATQVIRGQNIELYVNAQNMSPVDALALIPQFDTDYFELVSAEWLCTADLQSIEAGTNRAVSAWATPYTLSGNVYKIVLRGTNYTAASEIDFTALIQDDNGMREVPVTSISIAVIECPHANYTHTTIDATSHSSVCDVCGQTETRAHSFDNGCDTTCNDNCGYVREPSHTPGEWQSDNDIHWHVCTVCGTTFDQDQHVYDDVMDILCNECSYSRVMRGDFEGDNDVDSDDAIYLLSGFFFSDDYPLNQEPDMDGDGDFDSDDAIYLLSYVFFPDDYPLN